MHFVSTSIHSRGKHSLRIPGKLTRSETQGMNLNHNHYRHILPTLPTATANKCTTMTTPPTPSICHDVSCGSHTPVLVVSARQMQDERFMYLISHKTINLAFGSIVVTISVSQFTLNADDLGSFPQNQNFFIFIFISSLCTPRHPPLLSKSKLPRAKLIHNLPRPPPFPLPTSPINLSSSSYPP